LGMAGGVVAWAMHVQSTLAVHSETLAQCEIQVNELTLLRARLGEIIANQQVIMKQTAAGSGTR
jgi:hypothetical protein